MLQVQNKLDTSRVRFSTLLFGKGGSGKTTLSATSRKPLYIDVRGNLLTISKKINSNKVAYVTPRTYEEITSICNNNGGILDPFETIILDSITFLERRLIRAITPKLDNEHPSPRNWGFMREKIYQLLTPLIDLARNDEKDVILLGHERVIEADGRAPQGTIDIVGTLREQVPAMVDCIFRTDFISNKHVVRTVPHEGLWTCGVKSDLCKLDPIIPFTQEEGFEMILSKLRGES